MGIPSYFRRIVQKYTHCVVSTLPDTASILCFDFNCLIYRCIRSPAMAAYPDTTDILEIENWESSLLKEIGICINEVWKTAGKPSHVYIGVDGVVPMAKIRQQRVRRFKSAWQRESKIEWDTNAITPGTYFMERLTTELVRIASKHGSKWVVSGINEPGEGEHKILNYIRTTGVPENGSIIVYGLDADLILLTMILSEEVKRNVFLLREKQEFSAPQSKESIQEYSFLNIQALKEYVQVTDYTSAINYVALMSLMGNDFLPHSLTHKLGEDGHDCVIRELYKMVDSKNWLVDSAGSINFSVLRLIFSKWANDEDVRMQKMIHKKQDQAKRGVLQGMDSSEGLPLKWNVEEVLLHKGGLRKDWRDIYWNWMNENVNREDVCKEYLRGFQWILDYYTGKPVDLHWMFPYWIPPLWSDLEKMTFMPLSYTNKEPPLYPQEQLAMVLPLSSWGLIRDPKLKRLPYICPQMWPTKFPFFSAGRKWLWECEARVPVLTAGRLRDVLNNEL